MTTPLLERDLKFDEAIGGIAVTIAYPDPLSHGDPWTIGWGHTGPEVRQGVTWTVEQCEAALVADIARAERSLDAQMPWWRSMSDVRQDCLLNMCFNMGIGKLEGFHHTLAAMQTHDYAAAADGMLASAWAQQVHHRAIRLASEMRSGAKAS